MSAPFLQLYVGDYLADTLDLTTEQHGAYLLLLMTMWRHGAKLPNEPKKLARIARVSFRRWHLVWEPISGFFYVEGGFIRNKRLEREHEKALSISKKRSANGVAGAAAKYMKNNEGSMANAIVGLKHSQIPEPDTYKKEEPKGSYKKTGSRLSADWSPSEEEMAFSVSEGIVGKALDREAAAFRDYWTSKTGASATKLDWTGTWRNWIRRAADQRRPRAGPQKPESAFMERQRAIKKDLERELGIAPKEPGFDNVIDLGQADYRTGWKA